jgi:hypothetical protein
MGRGARRVVLRGTATGNLKSARPSGNIADMELSQFSPNIPSASIAAVVGIAGLRVPPESRLDLDDDITQ